MAARYRGESITDHSTAARFGHTLPAVGPCNDGAVADRQSKTLRDMALSMGVLAVVALVLLGMYGWVSFSPAGPTDGQVLATDVDGGLQRAAPLVDFPIVIPAELPAGWTPSSFSFTEAATATAAQPAAVRGGWLTQEGRFITFVQSDGATAQVLTAELGGANPPTGTVQAGDDEWTTTTGRRSEQAWVRTVDGVTFLITGTASEQDFSLLAAAVAAGTTTDG
jgi:hypothetical protein